MRDYVRDNLGRFASTPNGKAVTAKVRDYKARVARSEGVPAQMRKNGVIPPKGANPKSLYPKPKPVDKAKPAPKKGRIVVNEYSEGGGARIRVQRPGFFW